MPTTPSASHAIPVVAAHVARLTYQITRLTGGAQANQSALHNGVEAAKEIFLALQHDGNHEEALQKIEHDLQALGQQMDLADETDSSF